MSEDFLPRCELLIEDRTARRDFCGTDVLIGIVVVIDGVRTAVNIPKEAWFKEAMNAYIECDKKNMEKRKDRKIEAEMRDIAELTE
jgi:hypothetical protein